ncbi:hypothetical protein C2G38_426501 [Gigaspora rosea]|uniref:Uncharacterized protein n=1 Tax=Gigaspora rosea TaxID=44941 RepID=A0A397VV89_9GLOM|nr:hypothetical protein C2G38_426501 [Gigaspora rosea]
MPFLFLFSFHSLLLILCITITPLFSYFSSPLFSTLFFVAPIARMSISKTCLRLSSRLSYFPVKLSHLSASLELIFIARLKLPGASFLYKSTLDFLLRSLLYFLLFLTRLHP